MIILHLILTLFCPLISFACGTHQDPIYPSVGFRDYSDETKSKAGTAIDCTLVAGGYKASLVMYLLSKYNPELSLDLLMAEYGEDKVEEVLDMQETAVARIYPHDADNPHFFAHLLSRRGPVTFGALTRQILAKGDEFFGQMCKCGTDFYEILETDEEWDTETKTKLFDLNRLLKALWENNDSDEFVDYIMRIHRNSELSLPGVECHTLKTKCLFIPLINYHGKDFDSEEYNKLDSQLDAFWCAQLERNGIKFERFYGAPREITKAESLFLALEGNKIAPYRSRRAQQMPRSSSEWMKLAEDTKRENSIDPVELKCLQEQFGAEKPEAVLLALGEAGKLLEKKF